MNIEPLRGVIAAVGVEATRVASANFGGAYALTDNASAQAREINRRVEIKLAKHAQ